MGMSGLGLGRLSQLLRFETVDDVADVVDLVEFIGVELHAKFLLNGKDQVELLNGIPAGNCFWTRLRRYFRYGHLKKVSGDLLNAAQKWIHLGLRLRDDLHPIGVLNGLAG